MGGIDERVRTNRHLELVQLAMGWFAIASGVSGSRRGSFRERWEFKVEVKGEKRVSYGFRFSSYNCGLCGLA